MPQEDQASRAFYDHELDETPRTGGRRRRPAADWGVGEDLFDRMPSRRFSRAKEPSELRGLSLVGSTLRTIWFSSARANGATAARPRTRIAMSSSPQDKESFVSHEG